MSIKKVFSEVNALLAANQTMLVSELMPQLIQLMSAKTTNGSNGPASYKDENGKVIAVFCYYHKKWELVADHEYGAKVGTNTGLNSMCKLGVNQWTKQQRDAKKASADLLSKLSSGELAIDQLTAVREEIEAKKNSIIFAETYPKSFESLDELLDSLEASEEPKVEAKPKSKAKSKKVVEQTEETN